MIELSRLLPVPGPLWGPYPLRPAADRAPAWRRPRWLGALGQCRAIVRAVPAAQEAWRRLDAEALEPALVSLRTRLRREGLREAPLAQALAAASVTAAEQLGWTAREPQLLAATALLHNRLAEMATGEGKTLATGLAAAVAALAGVPVHVVTANAYLAARDAARLAPLFHALGLSVACAAGGDEAARRAAYAHDIVYATAKDLAFDFLRDRQDGALEPAAVATAAPRLRGLSLALLDEADSILLDEAEVPLILSRSMPQAARRAFLWQALALARRLEPGSDFELRRADRQALLTSAGEERLAVLAQGLGGPWQRPRYRREALHTALAALHLMRRDEHYVVRNGRVELLDEVTSRVAEGRVWSRGLHTLVALKEGLAPPDETETVAQTTFQRFFQRYWRLGGLSGTLWEARHELGRVYGAKVVRIPLHRPCLRREWPARIVAAAAPPWPEAVQRIAALAGAGRPVLVGVDGIAAARALAEALAAAGVPHRVLDALHDADEAAIVAAAGRAGQVTVATRMAGRGTDIELDAAARAAGGLHVLNLQCNPSRRLDRQLAGRAARHGDPGSVETWLVPSVLTSAGASGVDMDGSWNTASRPLSWPIAATLQRRWQQRREEGRRTAMRERLLEEDLRWEQRLAFAGPAR
jgi:preprotein translocase subunit SecA